VSTRFTFPEWYVKADGQQFVGGRYKAVKGYYVARDTPSGEARHPSGYFKPTKTRPLQSCLYLANELRDELND
jgi:hypothetical protein